MEPRQGYYTATKDGLLGLLEAVTDARALVITLGLVLARRRNGRDVAEGQSSQGALLMLPVRAGKRRA